MSKSTTRPYVINFELKDVQVKDLIGTRKLDSCEYIASEQAMQNVIKSSTVMDVEDIGEWLHEGDVLFISRFMRTCFSDEFIGMALEKKVSCIVTQKKFRTCVAQHQRDFLMINHLPLIFVDDTLSWSDMIFTIQNLIIHNQTHYLAENQKFQNSIINYLSSHSSVNSLCDIVYDLTGITIAIADRNLQIVDHTKNHDWKKELPHLSKKSLIDKVVIGENFNEAAMRGFRYQDSINETQYFIIPDWLSRYTAGFYIIIRCENSAPTLSPQIICRLETVGSIYSLKNSIISDLRKSNYYFKSVVFEELLEMTGEDEARKNRISLNLNIDLKEEYYLVLIKSLKNDALCKNVDLLTGFIDYIKHKGNIHEDFLIFVYKDYWVLLMNDAVGSIKDTCNAIYEMLVTYFENKKFVMGISNVYHYWQLKRAYNEALFAINYLQKNDRNHTILMYEDLGIIKLFSDEGCQINSVYTNELFQSFLKPILAYDESHTSDLYNTMLTFFSNDLSYKATSQSLFIHVNTLRVRIEKVEELLNIDLNRLDSVINLRLAVLLYQFGYFNSME